VRRLPRQALPARELRQIDQPLTALLELRGHVIEGSDGAPHLVVTEEIDARRQIPRGQSGESRGQLLDGMTNAPREVDQEKQSAPQIPQESIKYVRVKPRSR